MIGASKILTVSYGTFSCTLEGFDEPFSTMKAIAEYFRDLAADDRYFGAEPPQPDAAMLHRIAEREIQRRVEAKVQDNGVVLRAGDQAAPLPVVTAPPPPPSYAPAPAQAETAAERLRRMRAAAPAVVEPMVLPADPYEEEGADTLQALLADSTAAAEVQADIPSLAMAEDHLPEDEPQLDVPAVVAADILPESAPEPVTPELLPELLPELGAQEAEFAATVPPVLAPAAEAVIVETSDDAVLVAPFELPASEAPQTAAPVANAPADALADAMADPAMDDVQQDFAAQTVAQIADPATIAIEPSQDVAEDMAEAVAEDLSTLENLSTLEDLAPLQPADDTDAMLSALNAELAAELVDDTAAYDDQDAASAEPVADAIATVALDHDADAALISALNADLMAEEPAELQAADWTNDFADDDWDDEIDLSALQVEEAPAQISVKAESEIDPEVQTTAEEEAPAPYPFDEDDEALLAELDGPAEFEAVPALNDDAIVLADEGPASAATSAPAMVEDVAETAAPQPMAEAAAMLPEPLAEKLQRARARVIRIRRTEEDPQEAEEALAPAAPASSLLSAEAEAALQAELAALTAEFSVDGDQPAAVETVATAAPRKNLDSTEKDEAVDRLLAHANTAMEDEDSRRRQSALSHLKAAVVANEAERKVAGADLSAGPTRQEAYRADLEQVVRPARVEPRQGERMTPLVLVSEQRIDRPRSTTSTASLTVAASSTPATPVAGPVVPVRPRRVAPGAAAPTHRSVPPVAAVAPAQNDLMDEDDSDDAADEVAAENLFVEGENFTDFAERLGAENLADLIEAAGVYCATVLKRPEFPRPLILRQIAGLPGGAGASRDDVLRGFGQLLRDGRIAKVGHNQFAMTEQSSLLTEAKKIAG